MKDINQSKLPDKSKASCNLSN